MSAPQPLPSAPAPKTGFPSPADDHHERPLELRDLIDTHPEATFYLRARGNGLRDRGVDDGDALVVDRSLPPRDGCLAVAAIDGAIVLGVLRVEGGRVRAVVTAFGERAVGEGDVDEGGVGTAELWGCVAYSLRDHCRP